MSIGVPETLLSVENLQKYFDKIFNKCLDSKSLYKLDIEIKETNNEYDYITLRLIKESEE